MEQAAAFIVSLVAVIIATVSTIISYLIYRAQRDPNVVVYAVVDLTRPSVLNLIIENIGGSPALDVSFQSDRPVPKDAWGFENAEVPPKMDVGPLVVGIPSLGPGARRTITWGQYGGLHKALGDNCLNVTATYSAQVPLALLKKRFSTVSRIDIQSFEYEDASDRNWDKKAAEALAEIEKSIKRITSQGSLKVTIENRSERIERDS